MRRKEKEDERKIGINERVPWNKEP